MPQAHVDVWIQFEALASLSTLWVPGIKLRPLNLAVKAFTLHPKRSQQTFEDADSHHKMREWMIDFNYK